MINQRLYDEMDDAELRQEVARSAGLLAHRIGYFQAMKALKSITYALRRQWLEEDAK